MSSVPQQETGTVVLYANKAMMAPTSPKPATLEPKWAAPLPVGAYVAIPLDEELEAEEVTEAKVDNEETLEADVEPATNGVVVVVEKEEVVEVVLGADEVVVEVVEVVLGTDEVVELVVVVVLALLEEPATLTMSNCPVWARIPVLPVVLLTKLNW